MNDRRLYSNLCCEFKRALKPTSACCAALGLAALIDGLWLRSVFTGKSFDVEQAMQVAFDYIDLQLMKVDTYTRPARREPGRSS